MNRTIFKVEFEPHRRINVLRVAAYARVSSGKDSMLHSLSAQVSCYSDMIQKHPGWLYCGVYADEALTGTKEARESFQRLLTDCRAGKIDLVITKSISRFARNTVTLLATIRELKGLGVDVFFEEQNIHTMSTDGELMISILASYAQEESRSASENQKWRVKKCFEAGIPYDPTLLDYRIKDGKYVIEPEEAKTVKRIYEQYLSGKGIQTIVNELNQNGILTRFGMEWHISGVQRILRNITYTGNLVLQKTFRENHITKRKIINTGELPKYKVTDSHEAIIDMATFNAVQSEIERRAKKHSHPRNVKEKFPFTSLIVCDRCGKNYRRKITTGGPVWICPTYNAKGKVACPSKQIPEPTLEAITADVDLATVKEIRAQDRNELLINYRDGTAETRTWKDRSRAESWTPEMRAAAGRKAKERRNQNA